MRRFFASLMVCGWGGLAACGSSGVSGTQWSSVGGSGGEAAGTGGGTGTTTHPTTTTSSFTTSSTTDTTSSSSSSTGGSGGTGGTGGTGGSPACDYSPPNTCVQAQEMSQINGDTGNDVRTVTGSTSKWFKVLVYEGSNFISSLSYDATLESPPGMDFDLYAYPGDATMPDCFGTPVAAAGSPESVSDSWSDSFGTDDSRWVTFEVRYISGTACGPSAKWTLTVKGNVP